jgi:hypothetical protein
MHLEGRQVRFTTGKHHNLRPQCSPQDHGDADRLTHQKKSWWIQSFEQKHQRAQLPGQGSTKPATSLRKDRLQIANGIGRIPVILLQKGNNLSPVDKMTNLPGLYLAYSRLLLTTNPSTLNPRRRSTLVPPWAATTNLTHRQRSRDNVGRNCPENSGVAGYRVPREHMPPPGSLFGPQHPRATHSTYP